MANNAAMRRLGHGDRLSTRGRLRAAMLGAAPAPGLGLALALALAGCGAGGTETVSVSSKATPSPQTQKSSQAAPDKTSTSRSPTSASPSNPKPSARTGSAPAFVQQGGGGGSEDAQAALATVKAHGYTADEPSQYRSNQTLRVLIGTRTGSSDGHGQQAFFFVNGRYIGTDTSAASATVKLVRQSDTEVTLAYPLYRTHDSLCCPGGGEANVRFQLNNGKLVPLDPIPPASSSTGLSRQ